MENETEIIVENEIEDILYLPITTILNNKSAMIATHSDNDRGFTGSDTGQTRYLRANGQSK